MKFRKIPFITLLKKVIISGNQRDQLTTFCLLHENFVCCLENLVLSQEKLVHKRFKKSLGLRISTFV